LEETSRTQESRSGRKKDSGGKGGPFLAARRAKQSDNGDPAGKTKEEKRSEPALRT